MIELRPNQERALNDMLTCNIGQVIMTTGGGKTICMIYDAIRRFEERPDATIVVVAPRILLATQLSSEFLEFLLDVKVFHCHSGETHHDSSTDPIILAAWHHLTPGKKIIFTTYNSLEKVRESEIEVDTIYFDEAHNSVRNSFFISTSYFSENSNRAYFFTATPRHGKNSFSTGMNIREIYGDILHHTSAPELIANGFIVPPQVRAFKVRTYDDDLSAAERDSLSLIETITTNNVNKVLVCSKSTSQIINLMKSTDFTQKVSELGYSYMYITSKTGAVIDNKMVDREVFFDTLNNWGKDPEKKFIVFHYSILSEGINVSGLESVIFMRGMNNTGICQSIGRIVRMNRDDSIAIQAGIISPGDFDEYKKPFGLVLIPVYGDCEIYKNKIVKSVQEVVDIAFERGEVVITKNK